ncbi:MAG: hypothetical protein ACI936_000835 [Paraglaciecola sp.]|jgi:hypothetical protein
MLSTQGSTMKEIENMGISDNVRPIGATGAEKRQMRKGYKALS